MTSFFSAELITMARTFLSISTALLHVFVTLMGVVARFNLLLFVFLDFKDNYSENTCFSRISLDSFSAFSRAFRRSSSTSGCNNARWKQARLMGTFIKWISVEIIHTKNQILYSLFILLHSFRLAFHMLLMTTIAIQTVFQSCLYSLPGGLR